MTQSLFLAKLLIRTGIAPLLPAVQRLTHGGAAFLRHYSDQLLATPLTQFRDFAAFQEVHGPDAMNLALGAPRFDRVPSGTTKLPADRRGWPSPWGLPELRATVAAQSRLDLDPSAEVLITQGAAGAFSLVLDSFVKPGDRVVLFDPTSPLYPLALRPRRARIRWLATWMEQGRTRFRLDALAKALSGARLLVLNSPANPTGGVISAEDLEQIAWWAQRKDVLICSDEVFAPYAYEALPPSIATLAAARQRTLILGSVSQSHALAALRVGWLAGQCHLVGACVVAAAARSPFVSTLCQQVALSALRQGDEIGQAIRSEFASRRRYVFERLEGLGLEPAWPAGAYFFWLPVHLLGVSGRTFAEQLLQTKRVLVTPGEFFGPSGSGQVRLSYAAEDGRLREGLSRLAEFVQGLRKQSSAVLSEAA